jgi:hypothetical protein
MQRLLTDAPKAVDANAHGVPAAINSNAGRGCDLH